jgi:hypothetical protein
MVVDFLDFRQMINHVATCKYMYIYVSTPRDTILKVFKNKEYMSSSLSPLYFFIWYSCQFQRRTWAKPIGWSRERLRDADCDIRDVPSSAALVGAGHISAMLMRSECLLGLVFVCLQLESLVLHPVPETSATHTCEYEKSYLARVPLPGLRYPLITTLRRRRICLIGR